MSPKYEITVSPRAYRQIVKLPRSDQSNLSKVIDKLAYIPRPRGYSKIVGGSFRIRKGNYRIIYELNESGKKVIILQVGHRKDIYKRL